MRNLILGLVLTGAGFSYGGETARSLYDSEIYSQIELASINDRNRDQFLADVRAGQVGTVLLSMCDRYDEPPERKRWFAKLAREIAFFRTNGVPTLVWINGFGYGNERTGYAGKLLAQSQRLTPFRGDRKTGAVCPTDPVMRRLLVEQVRDVARAGAQFILMDDDFVQTSRPGLMGCACPAHLARVSAAVGRPVGRADVVASFTGVPNQVRTAFLDVSGEIVLELARELRRTVNAVDPTIGMGICASFTHYDVEGASLQQLLEAFGGGARKLGRISGAPYWSIGGGHFAGARLEDTLEFVRMQSAWFRNADFPMLDENDTYPRKVSRVPPWLFELYDKAVIADGNLRRHKYMLCYGADRSEPGYLEAHLADQPDDQKLRRLFAGTRPYGVRVLYPRRSLREAELPPTFMGEHPIMNMFSFPLAASLLLRNGIPCRHEGEGPAIAFGTGAFEVGERERKRGVILDRSAADILKKRGVDVAAPCFRVLDVDVRSLNFTTYAKDAHREEILSALRRFSPHDGLVRLETSAPRVYSVIHRDDARGTFSVLLENMGEEPAEVLVRTPAEPTILDSLRGAFTATRDGVLLKSLPPHAYAAVRFNLHSSAARCGELDLGGNPYDYLVFSPKMPYWPYDKCSLGDTGDRYNDHFQVIYDKTRKVYYAFWTQATKEAAVDQHIAFSKSPDGGKTWCPARVLAGSENRRNPRLVASWQQPMLTQTGRLYVLWNQQTSSLSADWGEMFGIFSDDGGENWSAPQPVHWPKTALPPRNPGEPHNWCIWQRPLRLGPKGAFYSGISHYGEIVDFISYDNMDANPLVKDIKVSFHQTGKDALQAPPSFARRWVEEASIVKLPDGRLFAMLRSWTGSPLWTQSRDEGRSWATLSVLRDENGVPYRHCCSPCPMYDKAGCEAASGRYFAFIHNTFDENDKKNGAWQKRGPLYLIAGTYDPAGEQPVRFGRPRLFAPRENRNSFYASYTVDETGKGILWYPDMKYWLLGKVIGDEWFD